MKQNFEILSGLPSYVNMYVSIPENGYTEFSEGLAVKFVKKDNSEWIGNFERGNSHLKYASQLKNSEDILIISFGICFIMNVESTKPLIQFGFDYKEVYEFENSFILIGEYSISIMENINKIKHFDNLCYDGIYNVEINNDKLTAILNSYDSIENKIVKTNFALNLETLEFNETKVQKTWWKIWQ